MKILAFGDIHFHHQHRFSQITPDGFTVRELEHLSCADTILRVAKEENVDEIVFLGDLYQPVGDTISCQTQLAVCTFIDKIRKEYKLHMLVGNHDWSSSTNNQYAHKLIPYKYWNNVIVYDTPQIVNDFVFMPFIPDNEEAQMFLAKIQDKENKIVFSHLELKGVDVGGGILTKKGIEIITLKQFKMTLQGHYHSGGNYGKNIQIAGSTQRLSFKDPGLSRNNILIYDTETNKVKRRSFECPDWLIFDDSNINDILKADNNNYVKVDISMDILLTDEIKAKLEKFKKTDIHIDVNRIKVNRQVTEEIKTENEEDIIIQFVNKSENSEEQKIDLIDYGKKLLLRGK